nr:hypothetical protein [Streptomyces sp. CC228A]
MPTALTAARPPHPDHDRPDHPDDGRPDRPPHERPPGQGRLTHRRAGQPRWCTPAAARAALRVGAVHSGAVIAHLLVLAVLDPPGGPGLRDRLLSWDARHFAAIAADGYPAGFTYTQSGELTGNELAFFPLYPLAIAAVRAATGTDAGTAALLTAHLALLAATAALYALLARLHGERTALIGIVLFAGAQPMAVVLTMGYSEGLFTALAAGSLLAAHRRAWLTAGVLASLAGLTRPVAVAATLALATAAVLHMLRARRVAPRALAGVLLGCVGTPAYLLWVGHRLGRADAWFLIQEAGWGTYWDHGAGFAGFLGDALLRLDGWVPVSTAFLVLLLLAATAAAWRRGAWPPLLVYGTVVAVLTVGQSNYYHCKLRLLVPALLFLVPPARALARARPRTAAAVLAGLVLFGCWYGAHMLTTWPYAI